MASSAFPGASAPASDLLRRSCSEMTGGGFPLRSLGRARLGAAGLWMGRRRREVGVAVVAKIRKWKKHDYPWPAPGEIDPNVKGGSVSYLSHFKPLKDKPRPVTLPFEKPLTDLEKKIADVRKMADETGLDFSDQILSLEEKYQQALKDLYTHLTPIQRLSIARHPNRPTFLDHVLNITDKWVELHGDRAGYDDPAIVTGIGTIEGRNYMFMGHQKGRNTKENIERNFGMPTPHGYRKALRMMRYADHHGFPIITFIDTPGAYADLKSEELGQGEAIAQNLRTMFGLKVPIVSVVIGEGGSGGALAIGCSNKLLMLQNAVFYVASPEACAAILWKTSKAAPKAAEKLRITATELCKLKVADGIIPEPLGGAHADPSWTSQQIKIAIVEAMNEFLKMDAPAILHHRMLKFRHIGGFIEGEPVDPAKKVNMKKKEESVVPEEIQTEPDINIEDEIEKLKQQILKFRSDASTQPPDVDLNELIGKLKKEVDQEFAEAAKSMGFMERLETLRNEVGQATSSLEQPLDSSLKEKIVKLKQEFNESLPQCPNFASLNYKLDMLKEISRAKEVSERNDKVSSLKQDMNKAFNMVSERPDMKVKLESLKAEISDAGVSELSDLNDALKEKYLKLKREVESELINTLKSLQSSVESVAILEGNAKDSSLKQAINKAFKMVSERPGMKAKLELLKTEISDAGVSKPSDLNDALKEKIRKMKLEVGSELFNTLKSLQLSAEGVATSEGKVSSLKQDINKAFKMVSERPDMKAKLELLKTEISDAGVSKPSDLNDALKEKILKMIGGLGSELSNTLKSMQLNAEGVDTDLREKMEELDDQIAERIEDVVNSSELNSQIEALKLEVAKAGSSPDPESKGRIESMKQQIKQNLSQAVSSSQLIEKFDDLKRDIARQKESSTVDAEVGSAQGLDGDLGGTISTVDAEVGSAQGVDGDLGGTTSTVDAEVGSAQGLDGDLGGTKPDSSKVEINVGTNSRS